MSLLIDVISQHATARPQVIALRSATACMTYGELHASACRYADQLRACGVCRLGLFADNSIDWIVVDLAARIAGITLVPLPTFFSPTQLAHIVVAADLDTLLSDTSLAGEDRLAPLHDNFTDSGRSIAGFHLARRDVQAVVPSVDNVSLTDIAKVTFTSGSTGAPKGVLLTAQAMDAVADALTSALATVTMKNHLCVLPLSTLLENIAGVYVPLLRGTTVTVLSLPQVGLTGSSQFDAAVLLRAIDDFGADSLILTPQLLKSLVSTLHDAQRTLPGLQFVAVGGGRVAPSLLREARTCGLPVYEGYGLSECSSVVALNTPAHHLEGSCGKPLEHVGVRIEDGEIIVSGNASRGYLGDLRTVSADVATGDLGHIDAAGFLHITGRRKNLLITTYGRNISPEWIESELLSEQCIAQCMVFGDDRPHLGALIFALPTVSDTQLVEAIARINLQLPDYARIHVWHRLPQPFSQANGLLTENLRIRREAIAHHFQSQIESLYSISTMINVNAPATEVKSMSFYQQLTNTTQNQRNYLLTAPLISRALDGSITLPEYIGFLTQAYHHVKHTVPLLMTLGGRLAAEKEWLREAVAEYIEEELGHQEWILNDIEACGGDKEAVRNSRPAPATELMVAYAYDTITRNNPVGFFGMVFVLEGTSINLACRAADSIQTALQLPTKAFSYLRSHGSLDIGHMQFFEQLMNRISDEKDRQDIVHAAQMFFTLYADIFRGIQAPLAQAA